MINQKRINELLEMNIDELKQAIKEMHPEDREQLKEAFGMPKKSSQKSIVEHIDGTSKFIEESKK